MKRDYLPTFHEAQGGHRVSGCDSIRLHAPTPSGDEPPVTLEKAEGWTVVAMVLGGLIAVVLFAAAAWMGMP